MEKLKQIINSFYFIGLILESLGFVISISLLKTVNINLVLLLLPYIILSIVSVVLITIFFVNRLNSISIIKMHISEKRYWFDFVPTLIFLFHIIFNSISIFVCINYDKSWFLIFSLIVSIVVLSLALFTFFKSTLNINKELSDRRNRGANE